MMSSSHEVAGNVLMETAADTAQVRIAIADAHGIYRVGVCRILAEREELRVVAQVDSLAALRGVVDAEETDVVLLDASLLAADRRFVPDLLLAKPALKLIVMQPEGTSEDHTAEYYLDGVRGVISRGISPELLLRCVRRVAVGETWISNRSVGCLVQTYRTRANMGTGQQKLTAKEIAIIAGITQGMRNKEIATQLDTSEQVIKNCLRKIYDKLGVKDRLELALYCLNKRTGVLCEDEQSDLEVVAAG